jgi:hypothetical protein
MHSADCEQALRDFAQAADVDLDRVDASTLVRTMTNWYRAERADDVDLGADGDMLLFQWGTYDWGSGAAFEFDLTRQFIVDDLEDDDAFFQLSWTLLFQPTAASSAIGDGNRWCMHPDELDEFVSFIAGSAASEFCRTNEPEVRELDFGPAG